MHGFTDLPRPGCGGRDQALSSHPCHGSTCHVSLGLRIRQLPSQSGAALRPLPANGPQRLGFACLARAAAGPDFASLVWAAVAALAWPGPGRRSHVTHIARPGATATPLSPSPRRPEPRPCFIRLACAAVKCYSPRRGRHKASESLASPGPCKPLAARPRRLVADSHSPTARFHWPCTMASLSCRDRGQAFLDSPGPRPGFSRLRRAATLSPRLDSPCPGRDFWFEVRIGTVTGRLLEAYLLWRST